MSGCCFWVGTAASEVVAVTVQPSRWGRVHNTLWRRRGDDVRHQSLAVGAVGGSVTVPRRLNSKHGIACAAAGVGKTLRWTAPPSPPQLFLCWPPWWTGRVAGPERGWTWSAAWLSPL